MTCPDCERYKKSASMWRNKAYELAGTPLPWGREELRVGLTDEEIDQAWRSVDYTVPWEQHRIDIARAIEAKLKEKNT